MQKPLLFTDLNGVLLNGSRMTEPIPGRNSLLKLMFSNFDVVSWTSAVEYKRKGDKRVPHGTSRVKHAFGAERPNLKMELYADSCEDTGELVWCEGYTKPKLLKSVTHLKTHNPEAKALLNKAPWVVMIDDDAYKIDSNKAVVKLVSTFGDSKGETIERLSALLNKLATGSLTLETDRTWEVAEMDLNLEESPPAKRQCLGQ